MFRELSRLLDFLNLIMPLFCRVVVVPTAWKLATVSLCINGKCLNFEPRPAGGEGSTTYDLLCTADTDKSIPFDIMQSDLA